MKAGRPGARHGDDWPARMPHVSILSHHAVDSHGWHVAWKSPDWPLAVVREERLRGGSPGSILQCSSRLTSGTRT
jgi:hypothetical protein